MHSHKYQRAIYFLFEVYVIGALSFDILKVILHQHLVYKIVEIHFSFTLRNFICFRISKF